MKIVEIIHGGIWGEFVKIWKFILAIIVVIFQKNGNFKTLIL